MPQPEGIRDQTAEEVSSLGFWHRVLGLDVARSLRHAKVDPAVRAGGVVVLGIGLKNTVQVAVAEDFDRGLSAAARRLADRFDGLEDDQWVRTGERSDGARFTTETFARYLIHDPIHHLHDVEQGFARLGPT